MKKKQKIIEDDIESPYGIDFIQLGNTKTGVIRVYGNFSEPDAFMEKIEKAQELRRRAMEEVNKEFDKLYIESVKRKNIIPKTTD